MPLSPDDARPPYLQVADDLRTAIRRGDWGPGAQLPSTNDLVDTYGVARGTVRSALKLLTDEGLVVARQGSGVFVRTELPPDTSASDDDKLDLIVRRLGEVTQDVQRLGERVTELEGLVRQRDEAR